MLLLKTFNFPVLYMYWQSWCFSHKIAKCYVTLQKIFLFFPDFHHPKGVVPFPFLFSFTFQTVPIPTTPKFPPPFTIQLQLFGVCAGVSPYRTLFCTIRLSANNCTCLFSTFEYQVTTVKTNPSHQYQKNDSKSKTSLQNEMNWLMSGTNNIKHLLKLYFKKSLWIHKSSGDSSLIIQPPSLWVNNWFEETQLWIYYQTRG